MSDITRREFVTAAALTPLVLRAPDLDVQQSTSSGSNQLVIVVAGAGHNSLVAAAYLAKAGYRSVVCIRPVPARGRADRSPARRAATRPRRC